jgi:hypothetical protein
VYKGILHTPILQAASMFCGALFLLCLFLHSSSIVAGRRRTADDVLLLHHDRWRIGRDCRRRSRRRCCQATSSPRDWASRPHWRSSSLGPWGGLPGSRGPRCLD